MTNQSEEIDLMLQKLYILQRQRDGQIQMESKRIEEIKNGISEEDSTVGFSARQENLDMNSIEDLTRDIELMREIGRQRDAKIQTLLEQKKQVEAGHTVVIEPFVADPMPTVESTSYTQNQINQVGTQPNLVTSPIFIALIITSVVIFIILLIFIVNKVKNNKKIKTFRTTDKTYSSAITTGSFFKSFHSKSEKTSSFILSHPSTYSANSNVKSYAPTEILMY